MKIIDKKTFLDIQKQMFNKARDIDVAIFNAVFTNMPKDFVLDAISMYQNKDGGFGNALEIDNYNPKSSTAQVLEALNILKLVGFKNDSNNEMLQLMLKKVFNYLYNRIQIIDNKWCLTDESNNDVACASWYKHDNESRLRCNNNPTAALIGHTIYFCATSSPYYKKALQMLKTCLNDYLANDVVDKHEINCYLILLQALEEKQIIPPHLDEFKEKFFMDRKKIVERDKTKFNGVYPNLPLELFIDKTNDEEINSLIEANLDYLIDSLPSHGLWEVNFSWGNDYPEADGAMLKWMGCITYRNLWLLKRFNRLEE